MEDLVQVTLYDYLNFSEELENITEEELKILYENREFIRTNNQYN